MWEERASCNCVLNILFLKLDGGYTDITTLFLNGPKIFQNLKGGAQMISNRLLSLWRDNDNERLMLCHISDIWEENLPRMCKSNYCDLPFWWHWLEAALNLGDKGFGLGIRKPKFPSHFCCWFILRPRASLSPVTSSCLFYLSLEWMSCLPPLSNGENGTIFPYLRHRRGS